MAKSERWDGSKRGKINVLPPQVLVWYIQKSAINNVELGKETNYTYEGEMQRLQIHKDNIRFAKLFGGTYRSEAN